MVNDSRGFYTSRCFGTYTREGLAMLAEGIAPALIENVGRMAGMPMGPLEVTDSVGIDTALKITRQTTQGPAASIRTDAAEDFLAWIVEKNGRLGRKAARASTTTTRDGKRLRLWPDLFELRQGRMAHRSRSCRR